MSDGCVMNYGEDATEEQMELEVSQASRAAATIIGLCKVITDCTGCAELALIIALASMLEHNGEKPAAALRLLRTMVKNTELMKAVFDETSLTVVPIQVGSTAPPDPSNVH